MEKSVMMEIRLSLMLVSVSYMPFQVHLHICTVKKNNDLQTAVIENKFQLYLI